MVMLKWDEDTKRLFENGVDQGVLYLKKSDGTYDKGVAWNGLTKVSDRGHLDPHHFQISV